MCQTMHANTYVSRPLLSYMCHLHCMLVIIILTHPPVCPPLPQKRKEKENWFGDKSTQCVCTRILILLIMAYEMLYNAMMPFRFSLLRHDKNIEMHLIIL